MLFCGRSYSRNILGARVEPKQSSFEKVGKCPYFYDFLRFFCFSTSFTLLCISLLIIRKSEAATKVVFSKSRSANMQQICERTPMRKLDFNKISVDSFHFRRSPFEKNTFGGLLLEKSYYCTQVLEQALGKFENSRYSRILYLLSLQMLIQ